MTPIQKNEIPRSIPSAGDPHIEGAVDIFRFSETDNLKCKLTYGGRRAVSVYFSGRLRKRRLRLTSGKPIEQVLAEELRDDDEA